MNYLGARAHQYIWQIPSLVLLNGLPSFTNLHQTHPSATQLSYSRSRVPVCLRVLPVPERVPCQPYPCHCYFPSSPTRPLLLVFIQVYRAELPIACQCQRFDAFPLVTGRSVQESNSFSNSSAQSAQRYFQLSSTFSVYLQICNCLSLSASHICFLRGSSQSVCLRVAFECHFGVISPSLVQDVREPGREL